MTDLYLHIRSALQILTAPLRIAQNSGGTAASPVFSAAGGNDSDANISLEGSAPGAVLVHPVAPKTKKRSRKTGRRRRRKRKVSANPQRESPNPHETYSGEAAAVVRRTNLSVCARAFLLFLVRIYESCMVF